jgi:N-acetylglucosamine kinase-like BadF-type ATPase
VTDGPILLGVDGGNTKTVAVAAAADGTILGGARVLGTSDIYAVPPDVAVAIHHAVADAALASAGIVDVSGSADGGATDSRATVGRGARSVTAAFSLAGADWPEDIALLEEHHRRRWPGAIVVNDAIGALRAAVPHGPGVVVVCGTGAATGARGVDGRTWHTSFWQEPQGGHELGVRALRAIYRADLGIDPPTRLTDQILAATGELSVESLLHHASGRAVADRRDPAALAWIVLEAADAGDPAAVAIVAGQGMELGRTALAAARRVGIGPSDAFGLALTGGVLRHSGAGLRDAIARTVLAGAPGAVLLGPAMEPAAGALLLAFDAAGIAVDAPILERIRTGLDAVDLFDTHPARATPG